MTVMGFKIENLKLINAVLTAATDLVFFFVCLFKCQTILLLAETLCSSLYHQNQKYQVWDQGPCT